MASNQKSAERLISNIISSSPNTPPYPEKHSGMHGYLFRNIPASQVITFVNNFNSLSLLTRDPRPLIKHISNRQEDELKYWDIFIPSPKDNKRSHIIGDNITINLQRRTASLKAYEGSKAGFYLSLSSRGKVSGRGVERIGLGEEQVIQIHQQWLDENPSKTIQNIPDSVFRIMDRKPLLVLHFLDISETEGLNEKVRDISSLVTAWSISFPPTVTPQSSVEYRVNTSWIKTLDLSAELDDSDWELDS